MMEGIDFDRIAFILLVFMSTMTTAQSDDPIYSDKKIVVYGYSWYLATNRFPRPQQVRNEATTTLEITGRNQVDKLTSLMKLPAMEKASSLERENAGPLRVVIDFVSEDSVVTSYVSDGCNLFTDDYSRWRKLDRELYSWLSSVLLSDLPDCDA